MTLVTSLRFYPLLSAFISGKLLIFSGLPGAQKLKPATSIQHGKGAAEHAPSPLQQEPYKRIHGNGSSAVCAKRQIEDKR